LDGEGGVEWATGTSRMKSLASFVKSRRERPSQPEGLLAK
jgi:hypothetical protein